MFHSDLSRQASCEAAQSGCGDVGLSTLLTSVTRIVAETVGFRTAAIDLYRPAWDDFEVFVVHGGSKARGALLGRRRERSFWEDLLDVRFERRGAYLIPHERRPRRRLSYVPALEPNPAPNAWHPEDALLVPMRHSSGRLLGVLSLDEPVDGYRPADERLDVLVAMAAQGAWAIEAAQDAASAARHRSALEQLMRVSARLAANESAETILRAVCDATRGTLDFEVAAVQLADRATDRYRPVSTSGIDPERATLLDVPIAVLDRAFDPDFEVEGCYLLSREEALSRIGIEPLDFRSTANGRGRLAWNRHWLLVPLRDGDGKRTGFVWVDDPRDRLLPSRPTLQALRLFADQAETALQNATRLHALYEASEEHRALIEASPIGIIHLGVDRRIRSWNPAAKRMFGYADADVLGREPPWISEADRPVFHRRFDEQFDREISYAVYTDTRADGSAIEVATTSAPLRAPDGTATGMIAVLADITEQEQAKRELARREAEMRAMLESSPVALMLLDRAGRILWWSSAAPRIFGWTDAEAIGHPPRFVPEEAQTQFREALARVLAGESIAGAERTRVRKDGTPVEVRLSASPVFGDDGSVTGVFAALEDVTHTKLAERDLALRKAELEALHETALTLVGELTVEHVLEQVVAHAARLVGADSGFILLADAETDRLTPVVERGNFAGMRGAPLARGEGLSGRVWAERRALKVDDYSSWCGRASAYADANIHALACVPLLDGDEVIGVLGISHNEPGSTFDESSLILLERFAQLGSLALHNARLHEAAQSELEERAAAEEALLREKEYSERLIQTANAMIVGLDRDGRIEVFNEEAERITGYARDEVLGRNWFELSVPRHRDPDAQAWFTAWAAGACDLPQALEAPVLTADGGERLISWRNREVVFGGETRGMISFGIDLTEQHTLEEQLRQSQRMEAIGQLAGGIAHDFNNLLTAIIGYGELALAGLAPDTPQRQHVEEMKRAGERASDLTRQLLAFSRRQVLQPKALDLNSVVTGIEPMLTRLLGEDVTLVADLDPKLGATRADPGQIEQVLVNLAINARDAMPRGGRLLVETANVELDDEFAATHVGATPGAHAMLSVTDEGEGMDRETLDRIFEPFFTTKPPGRGTGLGLSTVYGIVKQSGGSIWARSEPGRGSTFDVYLPRTPEEPDDTPDRAPAADASGSETILLVEDDDVVRSLTAEMLDTAGYTVLAAPDATEAERLAAAHEGPIDLLVSDVVMPGLSGPELAERMVAIRPGLRVLFTSGYTEHAVTGYGELRPDVGFLEKPFTAAALRRKVRDLLDHRHDA